MGDDRQDTEIMLTSYEKKEPSSADNKEKDNVESSLLDNGEENDVRIITNDEKVKPEKDEGLSKDRYNAMYIILLIHGVGVLMPWNMFINANDYFTGYKLNVSVKHNVTSEAEAAEANVYQNYFLSCLGFVAQVPNVLLNGINLFWQRESGSPSCRIISSIIVIVIMFIVTIVLAIVDSTAWPAEFFWITMATVVIINMANGIYQNSIYGTAACLPFKYTNAVILGSNISGLVTSIIAIIAAVATPDPRTSAIYYFLTAIFILLVAFDTYFALPLIPFYNHYAKKAVKQTKTTSEETSYMSQYRIVIKKCWVNLLSVFFVFFVTLTCFPAIEANIHRIDDRFVIPKEFFSLIACFLFFNLFAVVGSLLTEFVRKPGPKYIWIPVLCRVLFIPFFMFCNFKPDRRKMPLLVENDYVYCLGSILLALTSGYFSSLTMMYAPSNVEGKFKRIAGMMAAFCLILGVLLGLVFSFPMIYIIENVGNFIFVDPTKNSTSMLMELPLNNGSRVLNDSWHHL